MTNTTGSAALITAVEKVWAEIQFQHPDTPDVIVTLASGAMRKGMRHGHFAPDRWARGETKVHELFLGGESLARGAVATLGTLLHEAAHGVANSREVKDTSRQGRYHNAKFRTLAEEMGIEVSHDPTRGWSETTVPETTISAYTVEVEMLQQAITAYRLVDLAAASTAKITPVYRCECNREIKVSKKAIAEGGLLCGVCKEPFTEVL